MKHELFSLTFDKMLWINDVSTNILGLKQMRIWFTIEFFPASKALQQHTWKSLYQNKMRPLIYLWQIYKKHKTCLTLGKMFFSFFMLKKLVYSLCWWTNSFFVPTEIQLKLMYCCVELSLCIIKIKKKCFSYIVSLSLLPLSFSLFLIV